MTHRFQTDFRSAAHAVVGTVGFAAPDLHECLIYDLKDPREVIDARARHGLQVEVAPNKGGNVLVAHRDLHAPRLRLRYLASACCCVLGDNATIEGTIMLRGYRGHAVIAGGSEPTQLALNASLLSARQTFFWGRESSAAGLTLVLRGKHASVTVGDDCSFGSETRITVGQAPMVIDLDRQRPKRAQTETIVGPHVWVGRGATLMGGVRIGAGTLVEDQTRVPSRTHCAPMASYAGNPARPTQFGVTWHRPKLPAAALTEYSNDIIAKYGDAHPTPYRSTLFGLRMPHVAAENIKPLWSRALAALAEHPRAPSIRSTEPSSTAASGSDDGSSGRPATKRRGPVPRTANKASRIPLFCFWEPRDKMPPYLALCVETWSRHFREFEPILLDYEGLERYVELPYDPNNLRTLSMAQQADCMRASLLAKHGGLWLDCDTIALRSAQPILDLAEGHELLTFGIPGRYSAINVLYAPRPEATVLREWEAAVRERVAQMPAQRPWDYVGNGVLDPWIQSGRFSEEQWKIHPLSDVGFFVENIALKRSGPDAYKDFWFQTNESVELALLNDDQFLIELHNSWTPTWYRQKPRDWLVSDSPELLSRVLRYALLSG